MKKKTICREFQCKKREEVTLPQIHFTETKFVQLLFSHLNITNFEFQHILFKLI